MRLVSCDMLTPDMILARDIYKGQQIYLTAGQSGIHKYTRKLHRLGIQYIYVEDGESEGIDIPDAITEETRVKCKLALQDTLQQFHKTSHMDMDRLSQGMQSLLDEVMQNKEIQVSLIDISSLEDNTFSHSVSTAVYSLLIARELELSQGMLEKLVAGALLHDVGKTVMDPGVLFKAGRLSDEEFEQIKLHTVFGYEMLQHCSTLTELSKQIALSHHERLDGSGYPNRLKGDEIHEFSRIVAIADVYDALTSDRCYREKWATNRAVDLLMEESGSHFDHDMVRIFIQQIAIYPNGSMVRLSNGYLALVVRQNKSSPLRPVVRVVRDSENRRVHFYEIDLMKELSVVIEESQLEILRQETGY